MKTVLISSALAIGCGAVFAKLPPPDDATKAKAAETAAKAAWQSKVDAFQLCKAQDKVAAVYMKNAGKSGPKPASSETPKPAAPGAVAASAATPAASAASAAAPAASGTPVAAKPPPPCADPGPFAYNPPDQKPLESSGAHSPSGTAASPPSVKPNSSEMAPAKKP